MKSLLQRMRRKVGVEDRNYVQEAYAGLLNQYRTGGNPHAESPAVSFLARSLSAASAPAVFTPSLLHDAAIDYATRHHGFCGLIEVDAGGNLELIRASKAAVHGSYLNPRFDLTLSGHGDRDVQVSNVSAEQVFQVRYSERGSVFDVHPELARTEARLLRALADEVGAPTGQILALGIREGGKDASDKKRGPLSDELSALRGGLATFVSAESGTGGESGATTFQPRPWTPTRLGASPPDALIQLNKQIDEMLASALGVPASLLHGSAQTGLRESLRVFISTTLQPLAARFRHEAQEKLGLADDWTFPNLVASDVATRARAYAQLVKAKMPIDDARRISGLEE